ncbi:MAG: hypothetical protein CSA74_05915 [Rhodobacterales bacterium]|nr:MAG: hypothetical protein CSA74_05915 [Rhodobacterales bacterium]
MTKEFMLLALIAPLALAGCQSTTYHGGQPKLLARSTDTAWGDAAGPRNGIAAVAVTPDGCEAWLMDEGVEGYASTRSDPRTGLPVCSDRIPQGSVIGNPGISHDYPDYLP